MSKYGILIILLLCNCCGTAQEYFGRGYFVVKGKVENPSQDFFEFTLSNFLNFQTHSVPLRKDGSFEQSVPIQHRQKMNLMVGEDGVHLLVEQGDTLTFSWDDTRVRNTFSVSAQSAFRNRDLQLEYRLDTSVRLQYEQLLEDLAVNYGKGDPGDKYDQVNKLFNQHLQAALGSGPFTHHQISLAVELYYRFTGILFQQQLLPRYQLQPHVDSAYRWSVDVAKAGFSYDLLNEFWFRDIPEYRTFIFNYVRMFSPFKGWQSLMGTPAKPSNPVLDQYHRAQSAISLLPIRDWFLTKAVMFGFEHHGFADVEAVYQKVIADIGAPYLKDTLQKYYTAVSRLRPGNQAPDFALRDTKGNTVRLSNLRGKLIYMNWWGVHCSPCLYEIQNYEAALQQQYKGKDVVFVNICVNSDDAEWKAALKKYKLEGLNLTAPDWVDDPACKAYNIDGVPHYVIIDAKGIIVNNNAPRPSELKRQGQNNELERALMKKAL